MTVSAEMVTTYFGRELFPGPRWQVYEDDENTQAERRQLRTMLLEQFDKQFPNYENANWSYERQGGDWLERIKTTVEAENRLTAVIKQIELATGVAIKNHQNLDEITVDMYPDTTHLARYRGDVA